MQGITYRISIHAEKDIDDIYAYSLLNYGLSQADEYLVSLYGCFDMLTTHPYIGTEVNEVLEGAYRHIHKEHVIYYELSLKPLLILRVLGGRQDPLKQLITG